MSVKGRLYLSLVLSLELTTSVTLNPPTMTSFGWETLPETTLKDSIDYLICFNVILL